MTVPRAALVDLFVNADAPVSVPELHSAVNQHLATKPGDEPVNLVTVYRFANLLVEMGLANRIEFGQGYARYERSEPQDGPHHHHIVCETCGDVADFDECDITGLAKKLETSSGSPPTRTLRRLSGLPDRGRGLIVTALPTPIDRDRAPTPVPCPIGCGPS